MHSYSRKCIARRSRLSDRCQPSTASHDSLADRAKPQQSHAPAYRFLFSAIHIAARNKALPRAGKPPLLTCALAHNRVCIFAHTIPRVREGATPAPAAIWPPYQRQPRSGHPASASIMPRSGHRTNASASRDLATLSAPAAIWPPCQRQPRSGHPTSQRHAAIWPPYKPAVKAKTPRHCWRGVSWF